MTDVHVPSRVEKVELADGETIELRLEDAASHATVVAHGGDGRALGAARFDVAVGSHPSPASIEVVPSERGRGVGTELWRVLVDHASARGLRALVWSDPFDDNAARHLAQTSGTVCARRVHAHRAKTVFLVPAHQ